VPDDDYTITVEVKGRHTRGPKPTLEQTARAVERVQVDDEGAKASRPRRTTPSAPPWRFAATHQTGPRGEFAF
jgi:hypothetical protein